MIGLRRVVVFFLVLFFFTAGFFAAFLVAFVAAITSSFDVELGGFVCEGSPVITAASLQSLGANGRVQFVYRTLDILKVSPRGHRHTPQVGEVADGSQVTNRDAVHYPLSLLKDRSDDLCGGEF